jgi:hypothetical protein
MRIQQVRDQIRPRWNAGSSRQIGESPNTGFRIVRELDRFDIRLVLIPFRIPL